MKRLSRKNPATKKGYILLALFSTGLIVCLLSVIFVQQQASAVATEQIYVAEYETVEIPVPSAPVSAGVRISEIALETISFPKHQLPHGVVVNPGNLSGMLTISALPAKVPMFFANFSTKGSRSNPVIDRIPEGMRAMTIKVDATSAVEGWAGSGSYVDILLVEKDRTTVVAENVLILSAERSVAPVEGRASPNIPSTVTLLVSQEQCLAVNTSIPRGKIAFALRNLGDQDSWSDKSYSAARLARNGGNRVKRSEVSGYIEVEGKSKFVLSDGRWVETPNKPQGFFSGKASQENR